VLKIGIVLMTTTFFAGLLIAYPFAPNRMGNLAHLQASRLAAMSPVRADEAPAPQHDRSQEASVSSSAPQVVATADVPAMRPGQGKANNSRAASSSSYRQTGSARYNGPRPVLVAYKATPNHSARHGNGAHRRYATYRS
jgi:hypothetical protein